MCAWIWLVWNLIFFLSIYKSVQYVSWSSPPQQSAHSHHEWHQWCGQEKWLSYPSYKAAAAAAAALDSAFVEDLEPMSVCLLIIIYLSEDFIFLPVSKVISLNWVAPLIVQELDSWCERSESLTAAGRDRRAWQLLREIRELDSCCERSETLTVAVRDHRELDSCCERPESLTVAVRDHRKLDSCCERSEILTVAVRDHRELDSCCEIRELEFRNFWVWRMLLGTDAAETWSCAVRSFAVRGVCIWATYLDAWAFGCVYLIFCF
jgi:hypothetical protein